MRGIVKEMGTEPLWRMLGQLLFAVYEIFVSHKDKIYNFSLAALFVSYTVVQAILYYRRDKLRLHTFNWLVAYYGLRLVVVIAASMVLFTTTRSLFFRSEENFVLLALSFMAAIFSIRTAVHFINKLGSKPKPEIYSSRHLA
jgi:hypothetical protein